MNRNIRFCISVSYKVYPSKQQKWLKLPFLATKRHRIPYHISHEPLILWRWLTPHSNFSSHFCISVWYNIYYKVHLVNHSSYQNDSPLILIARHSFSLVLDIIHTLQSTGNGWNGCLWLKKCPTNVISLELLLIWRWTPYFDHITLFVFGISEVDVIDPIG